MDKIDNPIEKAVGLIILFLWRGVIIGVLCSIIPCTILGLIYGGIGYLLFWGAILGVYIGVFNGLFLGIWTAFWWGKNRKHYMYAMIGVAVIFTVTLVVRTLPTWTYDSITYTYETREGWFMTETAKDYTRRNFSQILFWIGMMSGAAGIGSYVLCRWYLHQKWSKFALPVHSLPTGGEPPVSLSKTP